MYKMALAADDARMLKLRDLFENPRLAEMLLNNWEHDPSSLDLFQGFRISANAIYPCRINGEVCYLRLCPTFEKRAANIEAELDFIGYLRQRNYNALEPLASKAGSLLVQKATPWGDYFASVFRGVRGDPISKSTFSDEIVFAYGESLGQLHGLSSAYTPSNHKRWTYLDVLDWIEQILKELGTFAAPQVELALLKEYFASLPVHPESYGLIHYDFEADNVFYDPTTKSCSVIDFDDAMVHWYVMDVVQALESLKDEVPPSRYPEKEEVFLNGYRTRFNIHPDLLAARPAFLRFANLYGYARMARSIQEQWDNEPDWLVNLRRKLNLALEKNAQLFGKPLDH